VGGEIQMSHSLFNNIGIPSIAISAILPFLPGTAMSLPKALLIMPLVTNSELLNYVARKGIFTKGLEKLIIENPTCFLNFNNRFYDSLTTSINGLQFLLNIDAVSFRDGSIFAERRIEYEDGMGDRAKKIFSAAQNLASVLHDSDENLYLNLRVEL
jgi:hypothetical protein